MMTKKTTAVRYARLYYIRFKYDGARRLVVAMIGYGVMVLGVGVLRERENSEIRQMHFSASDEKFSGETFGAYC